LVEHLLCKQGVGGSSPLVSTVEVDIGASPIPRMSSPFQRVKPKAAPKQIQATVGEGIELRVRGEPLSSISGVVMRGALAAAFLVVSFAACGNQSQCEDLQEKRNAIDEQMAETPPDDVEAYNELVERNNARLEQMQELDCDLSAYFS
jgi:hypothetical protein